MMLISDHIGRIGWVKWLAVRCKELVKRWGDDVSLQLLHRIILTNVFPICLITEDVFGFSI
jgi:hypothetical protein